MTEFERRRMSFVSEFSFGNFMSRNGLDAEERELVVMSVIAALGEGQLAGHVGGALETGNTGDELLASVLLCMPYNGFPRGLNIYSVVDEVIKARQERGSGEGSQSGQN